tara:strand:- start:745 stop:1026 length:282 start_codon:yes stop_codon:yes gene_type:complete
MADLGSKKIGSNYQKLLQQDGTLQNGTGSNVSLNISGHVTASGNISASGTSHIFNLPTSDPGVVGALFVTGSFPGVDLGAMTGSARILMVSQG